MMAYISITRASFNDIGAHMMDTARSGSQDRLRITVRTVIILMILTVRGAYWLVEQPGSSVVLHFPELVLLRALMEASGIQTYFQRL